MTGIEAVPFPGRWMDLDDEGRMEANDLAYDALFCPNRHNLYKASRLHIAFTELNSTRIIKFKSQRMLLD
jgi:hypothetical protein